MNDDEQMVDKRSASRMNGDDKQGAEQSDTPAEALTGTAELAAANEKAETYYKNWQRSAADFVNYKRRIEQERNELSRFASAALVINLLPVFDDLDRAVSTVDAQLAGLNW